MASFFDRRADQYDAQMHASLEESETYYRKLAEPLPKKDRSLFILDIGCGTGLELPAIWERTPKASLMCIDLSREMLTKLKEKFPEKSLTLIQGSYLSLDMGKNTFDAILSSMTLHHLLPEQKLEL